MEASSCSLCEHGHLLLEEAKLSSGFLLSRFFDVQCHVIALHCIALHILFFAHIGWIISCSLLSSTPYHSQVSNSIWFILFKYPFYSQLIKLTTTNIQGKSSQLNDDTVIRKSSQRRKLSKVVDDESDG
jgi:hypothetical protein